jgi:hypothetical protein
MGVEWWQCDRDRREETASIVDLVAAYALAIFAISLFTSQQLTPFELANGFTARTLLWVLIGFVLAPLVMLVLRLCQPKSRWTRGITLGTSRQLWTILSGAGIAAVVGTAAGIGLHRACGVDASAGLGLAIGSATCGIVGAFLFGKRKHLMAPSAAA